MANYLQQDEPIQSYKHKLDLKMVRYLSVFMLTVIASMGWLAAEDPKYVITPGRGLAQIELGDSVEKLFKAFGKPTDKVVMDPKERERFPGDYWIIFGRSGVEALIEDKKIRTLFFHFKSKKDAAFNGVTDKGIKFSSSVRDVVISYGNPDRTGKSIVSEFGDYPGAQEIRMYYDALGVSFLFLDGELSQIIVTKKK